VYGNEPQHAEERLRVAEELDDARRAGVTVYAVFFSLTTMGMAFLEAGQRGRAEEAWSEFRSLAERSERPGNLLSSLLFIAATGSTIVAVGNADGAFESVTPAKASENIN